MDKLHQPIALAPLGNALQVRPNFDSLAIGVAGGASLVESGRRFGRKPGPTCPAIIISAHTICSALEIATSSAN